VNPQSVAVAMFMCQLANNFKIALLNRWVYTFRYIMRSSDSTYDAGYSPKFICIKMTVCINPVQHQV
jgi:hypothetical protein